jgi:hypothetical protein
MDNVRAATQVFGGYGFMNESAVGRFYRDAKVLEIGEGTSEVHRCSSPGNWDSGDYSRVVRLRGWLIRPAAYPAGTYRLDPGSSSASWGYPVRRASGPGYESGNLRSYIRLSASFEEKP